MPRPFKPRLPVASTPAGKTFVSRLRRLRAVRDAHAALENHPEGGAAIDTPYALPTPEDLRRLWLDLKAVRRSPRARRVLRFVHPYRRYLVGLLVLMLATTAVGILYPIVFGRAVDAIVGATTHSLTTLGTVVLLLIVLVALNMLVGIGLSYLQAWIAARVTFDMRNDLFRHVQQLPMRFLARTKTGDIMSRLNGDITEIQSVATTALVNFVNSIFTLCATVVVLLVLNWQLFLITSAIAPLAAMALGRFRNTVHAVAKQAREANAELASLTVDSLGAMRFVRSLGAEAVQFRRYKAAGRRLIHSLLRFHLTSAVGGAVPGLVLMLGGALGLYVGGRMVILGDMTAGEFATFALLQGRLFGPLRGLMGLYLRLQRARASLDRVFEYLDLRPEAPDTELARSPGVVVGQIEFQNVSFGYDAEQPVLEDISFTIEPGERVALVGASGAGKSTLVDLLWRFYAPWQGTIRIDGHDLAELNHAELIAQMMVVESEPFLFNDTLAANIAYGRADASRADIEMAANAAHLGEVVAALANGLDTRVGERGAQLSNGQRQRVALARAFLRRPRLLVLDEATSSLDWLAEAAIEQSLDRLMQGTTTLLITHRIARARQTDRILVLADGRIAERGTHLELAGAGGLYSRLVERESGSPPTPGVGDLTAKLSGRPQLPGTGRGVRVALIDSGVNTAHPHVGRVASGATVATDAEGGTHIQAGEFADLNGHGTAVAALVSTFAPDAELVAIRLFGKTLSTRAAELTDALAYALDAGATVVNLSLGTPPGNHVESLVHTCRQAEAAGAVLVAAKPHGIASLPADLPTVIAVEENRALGDDELELVSTTPLVVRASGYARPRPGMHPEANFKGSSFAAARVTSVVARLLENGPPRDPATVRQVLANHIRRTD